MSQELPDELTIDGKNYLRQTSLMDKDGWYLGWVPLPLSGDFEIEFSSDSGKTVSDTLTFRDGRWRGKTWSLEPGRGTGEPDTDRWRI